MAENWAMPPTSATASNTCSPSRWTGVVCPEAAPGPGGLAVAGRWATAMHGLLLVGPAPTPIGAGSSIRADEGSLKPRAERPPSLGPRVFWGFPEKRQ